MKQRFQGWDAVARLLRIEAQSQQLLANEKGEKAAHLNDGQRASLSFRLPSLEALHGRLPSPAEELQILQEAESSLQ